ncbi:TrkH family potassium uptake protein [Candidatus Poribacteria bacterium]|nr:TrkH family potassium uptake protein [Candidatus Poribacteria bacterium]
MLCPLLIAFYQRTTEGGSDLQAFILSFCITLIVGLVLRLTTKSNQGLGNKEGVAVVSLGWAVTALFGSLPYLFDRVFAEAGRNGLVEFSFCYFEAMSGFTTTGATVLTEIEHLTHAILFWRSLTHWLGGMGIVVLALAILPMLGVGGMQLYRAEVPGPQKDRLTPRIAQTAKLLWGVYVLISAVEMLLLRLGGMTWFDALCHTFGTMATGGFSTQNLSIGQYNNVYFDVVIIVFMFIAGTNFSLHYRALRGDFNGYVRDPEFRFYGLTLSLCIGLIVWNTMTARVGEQIVFESFGTALRYASFQVVSIITTTGYGTFDFELWPALSQFILVILMFFGGCAGSTGGGMKHVRLLLLIKQGYVEIKRLILPHAVLPVKLGDRVVPQEVMAHILGFFFLFIGIFAIVTCIMATLGLDLISAAAATIATMGNIGPGLGSVGPIDNYAHIPTLGKFILSLCMLLGRLELYTVLVLFAPELWRR